MWASLRSDLTEFVSSVAEDTSEALTAVDNALAANRDEEVDDLAIAIQDGDIMPEYASAGGGGGFENTGIVASAADEAARRSHLRETYSAPLDTEDEDVQAFLETFSVQNKTEDIATLLEENQKNNKIKEHFEALVPTEIAYGEFWTRYYYRCDADRIFKEWEEERLRVQQARAEAIHSGVESVKSFFGGAAKAVSSIAKTTGAADHNAAAGHPRTADAAGKPSFFGSTGRPPFVMNTAVSDDDVDEEEEDEEELGWDDDDDDDDFDDDDEEDIDAVDESSEIVFDTDTTEVDTLKQKLGQAEEERDMLHKTVEMQTKEIKALKEGSGGAAIADPSAKEELEKLKLVIFEKDSELAALKASLDDTHESVKDDASTKLKAKIASQDHELEKLKKDLVSKESELMKVKKDFDALSTEVEKLKQERVVDLASRDKERALVKSLQEAVESHQKVETEMKADMVALEKEIEAGKKQLAMITSTAQEMEMAENEKLVSLTDELEKAKQQKAQATKQAGDLEEQLSKLKLEMQAEKANFQTLLEAEKSKAAAAAAAAPAGDETSGESGVKVQAPPPEPVVRIAADVDVDDDDDWGDSWGDE